MKHAADHSPNSDVPSRKRINFRVTILMLVAVGTIASVIFAMMRDPSASCPDELIGAWTTAAAGYEQGMLVITSHAVVFSVGEGHLEAQTIRRLEIAPDSSRILYTLVYGTSRRNEQTLSLYYHIHDRTITFKNQPALVWTKTSVES